MSLIRYQPNNLLAQFNDEINRLFDARYNPVTEWSPAVDVKETDKEYVIHADVPGVEAKDIDAVNAAGTTRTKTKHTNELNALMAVSTVASVCRIRPMLNRCRRKAATVFWK